MQHLGDITKISGYTAPVVDCIIGGSPCQDLSVAGKRAGLDGERSGLFMEQIRIVKEMRENDRRNGRSGVDVRPRYMVWENVPGAFSSNKGEDFRIVLEEIAKIAEENISIPRSKDGKWRTSGCIMGHKWSIAWRVLDAQYWGVPQRRRRIALVADFGGQSAPEILFVSQSVSGHTNESQSQRKEAALDASRGIGTDDCIGVDVYNTTLTGDKPCPLTAEGHTSTGTCPKVMTPVTFEPGIAAREGGHIYENVSGTLRANAGDNQMATAYTVKIRGGCEGGGKGALVQTDKSATLSTLQDQILFAPVYSVENHPADSRVGINEDGIVQALTSRMGTGGGNVPMVLALDKAAYTQGKNARFNIGVDENGTAFTHIANGPGVVCYGIDHVITTGGNCTAQGSCVYEDVQATLKAGGTHAVCYSVDQGGGKSSCNVQEGQAPTLTCTHGGEPAVCYSTNHGTFHTQVEEGICATLQASDYKDPPTATYRYGTRYIVRRLTPLECERLQGYPDGWTQIGEVVGYDRQIDERTGEEYVQAIYEYIDDNGKKRKTSDAARYKALGNSIALPPWKWVLKRICACYERDATMASLFDGIGGFPYIWEQLNGKGSCLWASEIEEFPIAVTKVRIGQ